MYLSQAPCLHAGTSSDGDGADVGVRNADCEKSIFDRTVRYIRANSNRRITLSHLERKMGCSKFQLIRIFRSEMGETPHAFIMRKRLEEACDLLSRGESAAEVAAELGFVDQSHLIRRFKSVFGVTPYAFVQKGLQQSACVRKLAARDASDKSPAQAGLMMADA